MATRARIQVETGFQTLDIYLSPDRQWEHKLFTLSEHLPATLTFFGPGTLTLEETLAPEDKLVIQDFIPGRYSLLWEAEDNLTYEGFFEIHPHSMSLDNLSQMFEILEQKIPGLTRNPHFNNEAYRDLEYNQADYRELLFLTSKSRDLIEALTTIERHPVQAISQHYEKTPVSRHQTARSQRYAAMRGGSAATATYLEPVKTLTLDTAENRYLKYMLGYLAQLSRRKSLLVQSQQTKLEGQLKEVRRQNAELRQNISLLGTRNFSKSYTDWNGRLFQGEMEESRLEAERDNHKKTYAPLLELEARLNLFLEGGWLAKIPMIRVMEFPRHLVKHRGYGEIFQLFQVLESKNLSAYFQYPRHQTSKLFEFFAFLLCHEYLVGARLRPRQPVLDIYSEVAYMYDHPQGGTVRLSYDRTVTDVASARQGGTAQLVSLMGSRRPDVLLERFDKDGNVLSAMVVEVKYRRLKHIYQEDLDTDVVGQLNAYSLFGYFEPNRPLKRQLPIDVCVLYPQYGDAYLARDRVLGYDFIPVVPSSFSLKEVQYQPLFRKLSHFLKDL